MRPLILPSPFAKASEDGPLLLPQGEKGYAAPWPSPPAEDIEQTVRRADPDRWLASRFIADARQRTDVLALYAFDHVLARVPAMVTEPLMGEIRLTWWREALDEIYEGRTVRGHPVSLALADAVGRHGLDRAPLDDLIEARFGDLDAQPFADEAEMLAYADQTSGALMQAAAQALGAPRRPRSRPSGRPRLRPVAHGPPPRHRRQDAVGGGGDGSAIAGAGARGAEGRPQRPAGPGLPRRRLRRSGAPLRPRRAHDGAGKTAAGWVWATATGSV